MTYLYATMVFAGTALSIWAHLHLAARGIVDFPVPVIRRLREGPYRWFRHPMYVGTITALTGMGGLGGGFWTALALFTLSEMVMREWAWRETGDRRLWR